MLLNHGLAPDLYVVSMRGEHGLRNARLDVAELIAAKDDDRMIDRLLSEWGLSADAELAPDMARLVNTRTQHELTELLGRAAARSSGRRRRPSKTRLSAGAAVLVAAVAALLVLLLNGGSANPSGGTGHGSRVEYAGGVSMTHSDYLTGGGTSGPDVPGHTAIKIACRVRGLKVRNDGNPWWYRVGSAPWDGRYYVSADAFYNRPGQRNGQLAKTPFVDDRVHLCSGRRLS